MAAQMARAASDQGDRHGTGAAEERSCKTRRQTFSTRPAGAGSKILPLRRMLWPLRLHHRLDLTARNQASKIFGPADEHAFARGQSIRLHYHRRTVFLQVCQSLVSRSKSTMLSRWNTCLLH